MRHGPRPTAQGPRDTPRLRLSGHAFHAAFEPLEVVKAGWDGVIAACEKIGRDPSEVRLSLRMFLDPAMVMPSEKSIAGSKDQMLEMIAKAKGIGIDHIVIDPVARGGAAGRLDAVRQFMEDVAPHA